jgi:hypothetical protein
MFDSLAFIGVLVIITITVIGPHVNYLIYGDNPPPHIVRFNELYVEVFDAFASAIVGVLKTFRRTNATRKRGIDAKKIPPPDG